MAENSKTTAGDQEGIDASTGAESTVGPAPEQDRTPSEAPEETEEFTAEEESEIAADYLEELLDITDLDGDIEIEVRQNRNYLSVVTDDEVAQEDLEVLVGKNGEVLDALQELVRLSVLAATGNRSRLILDIGGHRARREKVLQGMAEQAVETVRADGGRLHLDPLSPYERKLVHDAVAALGFRSESEGEGPERHIVVSAPDQGTATNQDSAAATTASGSRPADGDAPAPGTSE